MGCGYPVGEQNDQEILSVRLDRGGAGSIILTPPDEGQMGPGSEPVNSFESEQLGRPRECAVWQVGRTTSLNETAKTVPSLLRFTAGKDELIATMMICA